ncbi:hypothetical protein BN946_scf184912.g1 [Trametes cinnabarina]|uniref:C2H2-type domain-containing protein n=1 Tax=Pycnoporus cinnabarinus TaxID=5643 RepID=A0A060SSI3_PYCCI|nr:hypothetical protein BN946_scf184912.g1 [Trametes cinnabarina]
MSLTRCQCCGSTFQDSGHHSRHLGLKPACQKFYNNLADERVQQKVAGDLPHVVVDQPATCLLDELDIGDVPADPTGSALPENDSARGCAGMPVVQKLRRVIIEEVEDEEGGIAEPWMAETFPTPVATGIDEFLKLPITRNQTQPTFKNKKAFFKKVDALPVGPRWICDVLTVQGDQVGPNGQPLTEELELWHRDPVECVRELIGNPAFKDYMAYAPVRMTRGDTRFYGEMNTAEWWWKTQGKLPTGACIAPLILASDKTNLTVLRGDQTAWPVYLTIGNIDKSVRRKPLAHAVLLLGYIPTSKLHCFSKSTRSDAVYRLFHTCMTKILDPLINAGLTGVDMTTPSNASSPAAEKIAVHGALYHTADILRKVGDGSSPPEFVKHGLRAMYEPFWADLPHTDIFASITPDILHQLHKGVIKDPLLVWVEKIVGKSALDERFAAMSKAHGLRHFARGISVLSQWTGAEAKEIEKVLLGLLVRRVSPRVLKAIRALLDFVYFAQYEVHSDTTLSQMRQALNTFHRNKNALIELGVREHFNIPKLHSLIHYVDAIIQLGCLNDVNTENSERLHIDYAKKAYRASSRREYLSQMTTWLQRQEAVERRQAYLAWRAGLLEAEDGTDDSSGEETDEEHTGDDEMDTRWDEVDDEVDDKVDDEVDDEDVDAGDVDNEVDDEMDNDEQVGEMDGARDKDVGSNDETDDDVDDDVGVASVETIISSYGAVDFLEEVNEYLRDDHPTLPLVTEYSTFRVYHSLTMLLPASIHISNDKRICKLRAAPAAPRIRDRKAVPAQFDCGLFIQDTDSNRSQRELTGLRPGQVRAIFRLPDWMNMAEPLLVRDLIRTCHLMPKFGPDDLGRTQWMEKNVLDESGVTLLYNRYYDFHTFVALS